MLDHLKYMGTDFQQELSASVPCVQVYLTHLFPRKLTILTAFAYNTYIFESPICVSEIISNNYLLT